MGLKETYEGMLKDIQQQERQHASLQRLAAERAEKFRRLCEPLPCLQKMYQESDKIYENIYKNTLVSKVSPDIQKTINEFVQICPGSAWQAPYSGWGKFQLADKSIHIVPGAGPENQSFQFGSQYHLCLPYCYSKGEEDCHGDTIWYGGNIIIFQDGFVLGLSGSDPKFSKKRFTDFCAQELVYFKKYGKFCSMTL